MQAATVAGIVCFCICIVISVAWGTDGASSTKKDDTANSKRRRNLLFSQVSVVTALDLLGFGITLCCLQFFDKLLFG